MYEQGEGYTNRGKKSHQVKCLNLGPEYSSKQGIIHYKSVSWWICKVIFRKKSLQMQQINFIPKLCFTFGCW